MSWGKIYCDTNWGENKYRTAGSIINEATPDCFQFPEFVSFKDHVRSEGATYEKMQCGIDILLFLGRSISITPQSPDNPTFSGILDTYTGATAGYSIRRLTNTYTGGLIRVRRSSDDAEQDIGYDANGEDLDTFGLLAFVNADVDTHTSDFSSGTDGWFANGGTADGNIDGISDGTTSKDDVLRMTLSGGSTNHSVRLNGAIGLGNVHDVSFEYYIPSGQTLDGIKFQTNSGLDGNYPQSVVGTWTSVTISDWSISGGDQFRVYGTDGGSITIDADGDVFYLKNIVVTQTTADGHITTWYDQTGNGNNATNSTASEQPLIVDGGSIIYEGATISRPAIEFDGVDDHLDIGTTLTSGFHTFYLHQTTKTSGFEYLFYNSADQIRLYDYLFRPFIDSVNYPSGMANDGFDARYLWEFARDDSDNIRNYRNGSQDDFSSGVPIAGVDGADFTINSIGAVSNTLQGSVQEIIIFNSDQSTNRSGIATAINNYFSIYTP